MINHAMFQRNGRSGFVLKPLALRIGSKDLLSKRTQHRFDVTIISAQQLPRPKNASGHEIMDKSVIDPYVQVTIHVPDWPWVPNRKSTPGEMASPSQMTAGGLGSPSSPRRTISCRTNAVKNNGFNPVWEEKLRIPFECVGDMMDLVFVRFVVRRQEDKDQEEPLAVYCAPLGSLEHGMFLDIIFSYFWRGELMLLIRLSTSSPARFTTVPVPVFDAVRQDQRYYGRSMIFTPNDWLVCVMRMCICDHEGRSGS